MNTTVFTQQVKVISDRLAHLYQGLNTSAALPPALLPSALKELGIVSERLQLAAKMLYQQNEQLLLADQTVKTERQRYQELLEFIPDPCLLTDATGIIQETNRAAAELLNLPQTLVIGQSLTAFIAPETRKQFQTQLQQFQQSAWKQQCQLSLQPRHDIAFKVNAVVESSRPAIDEPLTLRWLLCRQKDDSRGETLEASNSNAELNYSVQVYYKGEAIPLNPQIIWQVRSGLVKLTTFSDNGQEVLVGLAGAEAPFGPSLTALPLYEATALSDTELCSIPLADFESSPTLRQRLLPQISSRLKQTELLLTVYGQTRVADRLYSLLQLLKQEVGEPVANGTRLSVRLTHEELATACCTTRVTVTRLLSKLQQQKKLSLDSQHHLILKR